MNEVVLAHPVWTAIGTYGGSLKSVPAVDVHGHIRDQCRSCASAIRDDWGGSTPLSRLMMRLSSERAVGLHIHRLGPGLSENETSFSNIIAIECGSASAIRQKLSILATQERAAGALIDRQRSAGFFEIRRMRTMECGASGMTGRALAVISRSRRTRPLRGLRYPSGLCPTPV